METWFLVILSLCISTLLISSLNALSCLHGNGKKNRRLPPGPANVPVVGNLLWLYKPISELESVLRQLMIRHGPLITVRAGPRPLIFVGCRSLAHRALVQSGAIFSSRPAPLPTLRVIHQTHLVITSAAYGPTWRLLRHNLTSGILNPACIRSHSGSRRWVLSVLVRNLLEEKDNLARLMDHFQHAMFGLLVCMCFGEGVHEGVIKEIESMHLQILLSASWSNVLNLYPPRVTRIIFRKRWNDLARLRENQEKLMVPLIRSRVESTQKSDNCGGVLAMAYVDTLTNLRLPEENNRKLVEWEIVSLCTEFLSAGTDTTSTTLQWIMANIAKYPECQAKLFREIIGIVGPPPLASPGEHLARVVDEDNLQKMPYLKAVVLEGLRRHPPSHFVLPHRVIQEIEFDGYVIPKEALVNFMVADMGWDPNVWKDPMEFRPERFLNEIEAFDIKGNKEIKMMPFGVGRRMCPATSLALLHLEYFVANLVWYFEWTPCSEGDEIDLSEKHEFTTVMKNPLRARITPRIMY